MIPRSNPSFSTLKSALFILPLSPFVRSKNYPIDQRRTSPFLPSKFAQQFISLISCISMEPRFFHPLFENVETSFVINSKNSYPRIFDSQRFNAFPQRRTMTLRQFQLSFMLPSN